MNLDSIISLVLLIVGALLFYGPWRWAMTDIARQSFFVARDGIFDIAAEGRLSFDSGEYRTIRESLEHAIRFAHQASLPRFVVMSTALHNGGGGERVSDLRLAIARIEDDETRKEVERLVDQAYRDLVFSMTAKSLLDFVVTALAVLTVPVANIIRPMVSVLNRAKSLLFLKADYMLIEAEASKLYVRK